MADMSLPVESESWAPVMILAGLLWGASPAPIHFLEPRIINAVYLLPLALMLFILYRLGDSIARDPISLIGYLLSGMGMVIAGVGSILESTMEVGTLAQWGLAEGQVFYVGLFVILVGSTFFGAGLWREDRFSLVGPALFLVLPVTAVGFLGFNAMGLANLNWIPITVPYGLVWVIFGWELWESELF